MEAYHQRGNQQSWLYDGVFPLLAILQSKNIKQGVITNKPSRFTQPLLQQFGILDYFDLVYCGDTFDEKKPHPMRLINAAQSLDLGIKDCLMVGDSSNVSSLRKPVVCPVLGFAVVTTTRVAIYRIVHLIGYWIASNSVIVY